MSRYFCGLVVIALGFVAVPCWALTKDWNDGTDNWSNGAAWTPAGVPGAGDNAHIVFGDGVARTVTYDYAGPAIAIGNIAVDLTGPGTDATTLTMPAGNLTTNFGQSIGSNGRGTFNQTGGTNSLNTLPLRLGDFVGSTGVYNLSGTGVLAANIDEIFGYSGTGSFNQSGGTNTISGADEHLYLGVNGGTGNYTLTGGSLSAGVNENVGYFGTGNFDHSGGTNFVGDTLDIGVLAGVTGTYTLSGTGQLTTNNQLRVGNSGNGTFSQIGGTNNTGALTVGAASMGLGTYTLSGGAITVSGAETIGSLATGNGLQSGGTFTQNGGTHRVSALAIAIGNGSTGSFNLGNGTFVSTVSESIGEQGTGSFSQTGGTHTANNISIGGIAGASGNFGMSGGIASAANIYVGGGSAASGGTGVLTISGSGTVLTVPGTIKVYNTPGTSFSLINGTLNVGGINTGGVSSLFNWAGGTLNITNDVAWDPGGAANSTSVIFGSSLSLSSNRTLKVTGNETIGGNGAFNLTLNSSNTHTVTGNITLKTASTLTVNSNSTLNYGSFTQAGGAITGSTFRNATNFTYQSGSIQAQFVNAGSVTFGNSWTIGGILQNDALMTVAAGQTLTATSGINNFGNFVVAGGTIGQSSPFTNSIGGTLTAHGTINPTITNHGTVIVDGVLSLGTSLNNDGIIQGAGTVNLISTFFNNAGGVINATNPGGALSFTNLVNSAGSAVNVGPSSTLSITGNWTNSGIVTLQGSGSRLSGGTITNNGLIQGFGTITATLGTSNSGVFRASGGELDFTAGGVTNSSQSQFQILSGSTAMILQGMLSNSGTISLMGGAFDNNAHTLQNNGTINGYGTLRTSTLTNSSGRLISVGEGNMDLVGSVINNGVISIQSGRSAYFFGPVSGSGSFTGTGTAVFLASLSPGNSPALVTFAGGATLGGGTSLVMELGGSTVGSGYDKIDVEGQLSVGGALSVSRINGFVPAPWSSFDLMDWGSLAGTFSSISLPTLPVGQWDTSQLYVDGTLSVVLSGDFDHSGAVNAADYVVWRKGLGTIYSADDYGLWRAHYGEGDGGSGSGSAAIAAAVPEPGVAMLSLLAMVFAVLLRGGRRGLRR